MNNKIKERYLNSFDELNIISIEQFDTLDIKWFEDTLIDAYIEGFIGARYILDGEIEELDQDKINDALNKKYDGISILDKAKEYLMNKDTMGFNRLVTSEFHRMYNQGAFDYAKKNNIEIEKEWVAIMDERTRDTHYFLNGQRVPLDAYFYSYDGDKALFPGDFSNVSNNVNCRCILDYIKV